MTPQAAFPPSAPSPQPHRAPLWRWLLLALVLVVLDQGIKLWIVQNYAWGHSSAITSFFNFVRVHNTGAAFSFLAGHDGWQRWFNECPQVLSTGGRFDADLPEQSESPRRAVSNHAYVPRLPIEHQ